MKHWVLIFLIPILNFAQLAWSESLFSPALSSTERWVLKELVIGNEVDLRNQFPDEKDRVLGASFLERLLAGSFEEGTLHRHGVRIKHAIFRDPIDLVNAQILHEVKLMGCHFEKEVDLSNSVFNKGLYLDSSTFYSSARFRAMKVGRTLSSQKSIFREAADFCEVEVSLSFEANGAEFRHPEKKVDFNNIQVGKNVFIQKTKFSGPLSFAAAVIHGGMNANRAEFRNQKEEVIFKNMKIGSTALFFEAKFFGPVSFLTSTIGGSFLAMGAEFRNEAKPAEFDLLKVGGLVQFSETKFSGPVTFLSVEINGNFEAFDAEFQHLHHGTNFNGMKVGGNVHIEKSIFSAPVNFASMNITGSFEGSGAEFRNKNQGTTFNSTKVGRQALFERSTFLGPVDFGNAEISSNFKADGADFRGNASFSGVQVDGRASFMKTAFSAAVMMDGAKFLHLDIQGPEGWGKTDSIPLFDLSRAEVKGELQIQDLIVQRMVLTSLKVSGPTVLKNLTVNNEFSMEYATFLNINLYNISWPKPEKTMRINGMTYQYISAGDQKDSWEHLLKFVKDSAYDANNYKNLETFFRNQGYPSQADAVFMEHKQQEQKKFLTGIRWCWSLLLYYLVGYGRQPERTLLVSGFFIIMGTFIFRRKEGMEWRGMGETSPNYNAIWYSLDLFFPVLGLQVAGFWRPKQDRWFARNYAHFHRILGYVLIPFGVAALTGIIK